MESKAITINGQNLPVREHEGQRVVTVNDISLVHQVDQENISKNFRNNKKHFIEGIDYYFLRGKKATEKYSGGSNVTNLNLFTETGYLMLAKSLTDDLSWAVQRELVNAYFKFQAKEKYQTIDKFALIFQFLPERMRRVLHYLSLGLSIRDTAKLTAVNRGVINNIIVEAKKYGFKQPDKVRVDRKVLK